MILPEVTSNWTPFFEFLSSLILLVLFAPVVIVKSWGAQPIEKGSSYEDIPKSLAGKKLLLSGTHSLKLILGTVYMRKQLMLHIIPLKELKKVMELVWKRTLTTIGKDSNKWLVNKFTSLNYSPENAIRLNSVSIIS